jgi:hypothetical protein
VAKRREVGVAVAAVDHEVEDGAVVPEREAPPEIVAEHVRLEPGDPIGALTELRPREGEKTGRRCRRRCRRCTSSGRVSP